MKALYLHRKDYDNNFIKISNSSIFSNSLIQVDYYFEDLIWVNFPGVGKKYFNGQIRVNADKVSYPYVITVRLFRGKKKFVVEADAPKYKFLSNEVRGRLTNSFKLNNTSNQIKLNTGLRIENNIVFNGTPSFELQINKIDKLIFTKFSKKTNQL